MTNETMQAVLLQMQQQNQLIMELLQESSKGQDPDQTKKPVVNLDSLEDFLRKGEGGAD